MAGVYFNLGRRKTQVEFIKILRRAALSNANPHQMQKFPHGFQNQALQILSEHCKRFFFFFNFVHSDHQGSEQTQPLTLLP